MSTTKPHSFKPLWIKVAIFCSSSTTKILMHYISFPTKLFIIRTGMGTIGTSTTPVGSLIWIITPVRSPMKPNSDFGTEPFSGLGPLKVSVLASQRLHSPVTKTDLRNISLGVSHKDIFHIRFHPAVTQPTKVLIWPPLQPTVEERLRVARLNSQPTTA